MNYNKKYKIILTGGGTGGSVAPLLAIADELRAKDSKSLARLLESEFLWVGTKSGPERQMVENAGIKFRPIFFGKLRRYFSWRNFVDPVFIFLGFLQSLIIMLKWRPDVVISAGSFVSVPVIWAAWLLRRPILIHQQDARPGLANKLMAPCASAITVTFEKSLDDYGKKAVWIGNFVRGELINYKISRKEALQKIGLRSDLPVVLIMGGGTGASAINELVWQSADKLVKFCQIVHITGKNKIPDSGLQIPNYHYFEFVHTDGMAKAYTVADIVVSRCGMAVLTELSRLGKPAILIPMPDSHQEDNAAIFQEKKAAIVLNQKELTSEKLIENIKKLLSDERLREELRANIQKVIKRGANERIVEIVEKLLQR